MKRIETAVIGIGMALLVWRCASTGIAKHEGEFENLRVIRKDIPREELIRTMRGYSRALGVRCNFCHEGEEGAMDFASDAKDEKRNARVMIEMTRAINQQYLSRVEGHGLVVECATCHRGKVTPETQMPQPEH